MPPSSADLRKGRQKTPEIAAALACGPLRLHEKLRQIGHGCARAAERYESNAGAIALRLARLYVNRGLAPREVLRKGLADPRLPKEVLACCVSKRRLVRLQRKVNPDALFWETGDKSRFYARCRELGIPVPALYGIFGRGSGRTTNGVEVSGRREWARFFEHELTPDFVLKPAISGFGEGVMVISRVDGVFRSASGERFSAAGLYDFLTSTTPHDLFVIQERVFNHPAIARLSGTSFLQTVRMISFLDHRGHAAVDYVNFFKIINGDNIVDNFRYGRNSNLLANVSFDEGRLGPAMTVAPDGVGIAVVPNHPRTGLPIAGFRLPHWTEAVDLVRQSARAFHPVRTLGWDVALTSRGPVIMEANHFWDPVAMVLAGPQPPGGRRHRMQELLELMDGPRRTPLAFVHEHFW